MGQNQGQDPDLGFMQKRGKETLEVAAFSLSKMKSMIQTFDNLQSTIPLFSSLFNSQARTLQLEPEV